MRFLLIFVLLISILPPIAHSASSIRCACSTSLGDIQCHNEWCQVRGNATHFAACAVVHRNDGKQALACARVSERQDGGYCQVDIKRRATKCWCTEGDYCNVDLVDRIRDKRLSDENKDNEDDDFTVETNTEINEDNSNMDDEDSERIQVESKSPLPKIVDAVDMRKAAGTEKISPDDAEIKPWRRLNPLNVDEKWKPPPPPPMPGRLPLLLPTTTTTSTTTTTTTTRRPPTTTTFLSYEERIRQHEERRREMDLQREMELKRRAELERQRMEERRRLESQHETKRRFGEESRNWPVPDSIPDPVPTTTTTTSTATTSSTITTTTPPQTTTTTTTTIRPTTIRTVPAVTERKESKSYDSYYKNWNRNRRPFDLNPTVSVKNFSAIVYPPRNFVKASTTSTTSTFVTTTTATTTTTTLAPTTTTLETTTTTQLIIYPPPGFRKATKPQPTTATSTSYPRTTEVAYSLPMLDDEDNDVVETYQMEKKMIEMPKIESDDMEDVVMYTPKPASSRPLPSPSVRSPAEKMEEYKKLLDTEPSSSSIVLPSFISIIILFLL